MPGKGLEESSEDAQPGRGGQAGQAGRGKGQMIKRSKVRNQFFKNSPDLQKINSKISKYNSRASLSLFTCQGHSAFKKSIEQFMVYKTIFTSINMFIIEAGLVSLKTGTLCGVGDKLFMHNTFHISTHSISVHPWPCSRLLMDNDLLETGPDNRD